MLDISESIDDELPGLIDATPENIQIAREFVFQRWIERSNSRGDQTPVDLSSACKFASLFAWQLFGGTLAGNCRHQYILTQEGDVLDLCSGSAELRSMLEPYVHDAEFFANEEHLESLESCMLRVSDWLKKFNEAMLQSENSKVRNTYSVFHN